MLLKYVWKDGKKKALTFSYDDGNIHDRRLVEIFAKYGMKGTFNLCHPQSTEWHIPVEEYKSLYLDNGQEIACHAKTHPFLEQIPLMSVLEEILENRKDLEAAAGVPVRGMAYPFGTLSSSGACAPDVKEVLRSAGIVYARTTHPEERIQNIPSDFLEWHPTCHHNGNIMERAEKFLANPWGTQLLYIWGHAFEFANAKNWDLIENFCAKYTNDDRIWYATNGEIYDYVTACRRLITSADCSIVQNPSAQSVWIEHDNQIVEIKGGATVRL